VTLPDGTIRIVVAAEDPAIPGSNWLDTAGHAFGTDCFRWITCVGDSCSLVGFLCGSKASRLRNGRPNAGEETMVDGAVHAPRCRHFESIVALRAHCAE